MRHERDEEVVEGTNVPFFVHPPGAFVGPLLVRKPRFVPLRGQEGRADSGDLQFLPDRE